jgi:hypothetical protein
LKGKTEMSSTDIFDNIADIGREFLALSKSQETLKNYIWQLGTISDLIKHTHSIVVHKLEAVEEAASIEEAKSLVTELEGDPLTNSFRANHLCDIFQAFGTALRQLTSTLGSQERQSKWEKFCGTLESRENTVAELYADQLQDLIDLKYKLNIQQDLNQFKVAAKNARQKLTEQMADFDALAKKFRNL